MAQSISFMTFAQFCVAHINDKHIHVPSPLRVDLSTATAEAIAQLNAALSVAKAGDKKKGKRAEEVAEYLPYLQPTNVSRVIVTGNLTPSEVYGLEMQAGDYARVLEVSTGLYEVRAAAANSSDKKHAEKAVERILKRLTQPEYAGRVMVVRS